VERGPKYLEPRLLRNPAVALSQAGREVFRMGQLAKRSLEHAIAYFYTEVESEAGKSAELELAINELEREIPNYIVKLMETKLSREDSNLAYTYIQSVNDIERVADHTENVVELTEVRINKGIRFSNEAMSDLKLMLDKTVETFENALLCLEKNDQELAHKVIDSDDEIDEMEKKFRRAHITRLNEGRCTGDAGAIYLDLLSNLERIGDHSVNIAQYVIEDYLASIQDS
jgi:phosphate:Na+ symporter